MLRKALVALLLVALSSLVASTALAGPGGPWDVWKMSTVRSR